MGSRILLIMAILFKAILTQRIPCSCQRPTEIIGSGPTLAGNTESLCKDLAAAIQGVVVSNLRTNAARTPVFSQIPQPRAEEIATSINCPVCSSVSISPSYYSAGLIQPVVPNSLKAGNVCSCSKPVTGLVNAGNNLVSSQCGCSNNIVPKPVNTGNKLCSCGKTVAVNSANSPLSSSCGCSNAVSNSANNVCGGPNIVSVPLNAAEGLVRSPCLCSNSISNEATNLCGCSKSQSGFVNTANNLVNLPCGCANLVSNGANNICGCSKSVSGLINTANNLVSSSCGCSNSVLNGANNNNICGCTKLQPGVVNTANNLVNLPCGCSNSVSGRINTANNLISSPCGCSNPISNGANNVCGCTKIQPGVVNSANNLVNLPCRCSNLVSNEANNLCGCSKIQSGLVNTANANSLCGYCNSLGSSNDMMGLLNKANNLASSLTNAFISRSISSAPSNSSPNDKYSELLTIVNGLPNLSCPCRNSF